MHSLNSREEILKIDKQNVLGSIEALPQQCQQAWEKANEAYVPEYYRNINKVVMCGMGGSGLAARVIESVFQDQLKHPIIRVNNYDLPSYVNKETIVVCSSYSGNTEETLNNAKQAIEKRAKWIAIGSGGKLLDLAEENHIPYYKIFPDHNPSNQPRMAIGYSVVGQLVLVSKIGIFKFHQQDVEAIVNTMDSVIDRTKVEIDQPDNQAKKLAATMKDKIILFVSAQHLVGAMHTVNNQLNENAKTLSADFQIPELNHHLMEGLKHPITNPKNLLVIFATSTLYSDRIKKRFEVTLDVIKQNKIDYSEIEIKSESKLSQAFELIQFGAYMNLYLSILYGQDPSPIPWVDYFKEKLKKTTTSE